MLNVHIVNFVFFNPDEMRAESVSCYGHALVEMPNFDRLASEGVTFDQCHVQHPVCSPSRCGMMTGWYPHVSGHRTLWHLLRPHEPSLFRYLKNAGYHIEWHGKNDLYAAESFALAVDRFDRAPVERRRNRFSRDEAGYYSFLYEPLDVSPSETHDMQDVQAGIGFLDSPQSKDKPFLLYLPITLPHCPYTVPQPYYDMYVSADLPPLRPSETKGKPDFHRLIRQYRDLDRLDDGILQKIQAVYLGMNSYVDWMLGQLLEALERNGLVNDTAVVVFSDHGDWAGDYGLVEKWPSALDDTITRVPLIIRAPAGSGGSAGHVVREPVELHDVMATVLELAGIEASHTHFARSLVPQLRGADGDPERAVFAEGGYDTHETHCFEGRWTEYDLPRDPNHIYWPKGLQQQEHPQSVCRSVMIRTARHKLIRRTSGFGELYDLNADPLELNNLYADESYGGVRRQLEADLLSWYIHTSDAVPIQEDSRGFP
jgi:choline-sulfatase